MAGNKNEKARFIDEASFFNREADKILQNRKSFELTNAKTHVEIFQEIPYLKPVVPFFGDIKDKTLLDLACGDGWASLYFARSGAKVYCCDISPKCIDLARKYFAENGLEERVDAQVMAAEYLSYDDNFFDFVFINAGLHHCDVDQVICQIKRVLKKGGKAALLEDYAYHPVLWLYRIMTRSKHTKHENPLSKYCIQKMSTRFGKIEFRYSGLLNIFDTNNYVTNIFEKVDQKLFHKVHFLRKYARIIGIYIQN